MSEEPSRVALPGGDCGDGLSPADWARLADGCRRGDHACFTELVGLSQAALRRLLGRLVGRAGDLDELLQETYLRAWRGASRFRGDSTLNTWLTRIAVNVALNWRRDRRPTVPLERGRDLRLHASRDGPHEDVALAAYEQALAHLAPEFRTAFVLHESEGMTYRQMAEVLDCPIGTVMSRLHRAREQLIAELSERLEEFIPSPRTIP